MSTIPPPLPRAPMPKPPGLSPVQKAMVGFAIVATLFITLSSIFLLTWMNKAAKDTSLQFDVLGDAKKRQADRRAAYNGALAKLPAGDLPQGWSTANALKACSEGDLDLAHIVGEILFTGGDRFAPLDLPYLAQMLDNYEDENTIAATIHPSSNEPDVIEQNLLNFLRDSTELANLCKSIRLGIYFLDIDPTVSTWKHSIGEDAIPDRHCAAVLLELRALLEARWGTPQSAVEAYLDVTRFAELLGSDPYLSYHWLRYDVERRADIALWEMMDKHEIDGAALDSIKQSIARRADTTRLKELIVEDVDLETPRYFTASEAQNALTGKMAEMMGLYEPAKTHKAAVKLASYVDRPYAEMKKFTDEVSDEENDDAEHLGDIADRAQYARSEQLRGAMMTDVLALALALKQYKTRTGAYPNALALLMPDYVAAVPRDPRSDAEIEYMPWHDGFFLFAEGVSWDDEEDSYATYDAYYGYDYHDSGSSFGDGYTEDTLWHAET